ncbi:MAG: ACP S-malonyltransferase [Gammaproteobacteria bacterium]|jgi:[acyl-carrier-protein] S-malonyltransferase|nr:malonyl CoA-ACP transacylase [Chromatiales bacterium]MDP6414178.1 ACP S-malonyltransferase [Gammaproteobacteria bacterium]MDP6675466.1 ACP S-malonyltransferase [Gammaproteobacteria bacterium]
MANRKVMFVFPGQGSQYRGMGSDICSEYSVARDVYAESSDALGYDMTRLSFEDPDDEIGLTRFTQPALLTHSVACMRVFEELTNGQITPLMAAGHSLGEYTALVGAGSLSLSDGLALVQKRGELMGEHGTGGMLALTLDLETARPIADQFFCQVGGCNLPEQTVVGGKEQDLEELAAYVTENFPRKRAVPLATEGAFHTYFMVKAAQLFREVLDAADFSEPTYQVLANYTGNVHESDARGIRSRLFFQLFSPVKWVGCLQTALGQGVDTFVEFGGGLGASEDPAEKRPNLESIIKKTLRANKYEADYFASINCTTLRAAAEQLAS